MLPVLTRAKTLLGQGYVDALRPSFSGGRGDGTLQWDNSSLESGLKGSWIQILSLPLLDPLCDQVT